MSFSEIPNVESHGLSSPRPESEPAAPLTGKREDEAKTLEAFRAAETTLARVLSDFATLRGPETEMAAKAINECARCLRSLSSSLASLEELKSRLPARYQIDVTQVVNNQEHIKQVLRIYSLHADDCDSRLMRNELLLDAIIELRRIDAERFPRDLVEFTDDDLRALSFPAGERGWQWEEVVKGAKLAEYDPERFRRIFGNQYPPDVIVQMRAEADRLDATDQGDTPKYRELLAKMERAL